MSLTNVHLVFYGKDLELRGTKLDTLDKIDLKENDKVEFYPGHRYLVMWNDNAQNDQEQPYNIIQNKYGIHYGPRGENHYDFTKCPYLTTRNGIYFKFIYKRYYSHVEWLDEATYESMSKCVDQIKTRLRNAELESGVSKRTGNRWYRLRFDRLKEVGEDVTNFCDRQDYIKTPPELKFTKKIRVKEDIKNAFDYFINKPKETIFGLDYETSGGFPMDDSTFQVVGLGIACCDEEAVAAYFDLQWMLRYDRSAYDYFIERLNEYLDKFEDSVTYNNSFEQRVTYLITHRLILFDEGATVNKCDGLVYKRLSLKYTAQRVVGAWSWDDDYELLVNDLLPELFGWDEDTEEYKWTLEPEYDYIVDEGSMIVQEVLKTNTYSKVIDTGEVDEYGNNICNYEEVEVGTWYRNNPVWQKICELYPNEVDEFITLIEYPGAYGDPFACVPSNLQTYYCCRDSFYTGHLKIDCLKRYSKLCYDTYNNNLRLEAILHLTGFFINEPERLRMELQCLWMEVYGKLNVTKWALHEKLNWFKNLQVPEIPEISELLRLGYDPCDSKSIIMNHLSETSESGIDEEYLEGVLGREVLDIYIRYIKEYCYRIDESYKRSRKIFNELNSDLIERYKPDFGEGDLEGTYCKWTVKGVDYKIDLNYQMLCDYYSTKSNYEIINCFCDQLDFNEIEKLMLPHLGKANLPLKFYAPKNMKDYVVKIPESYFCGYIESEHMEYRQLLDEYSLDDILEFTDNAYNYKSAKVSPYFKFMAFQKYKGILYHAFATDYESLPVDQPHPVDASELQECVAKEFTLEWIERTAKTLINEDLEKLKKTNAWKYYELNHDIISLLYAGIMEETWYNEETDKDESLFCYTDTGEKDEETGKPILGWSNEIDEWYNCVSEELAGWYDFITRYVGYWTIDEEDKDHFHKNMNNIDVLGDTVESMAKMNFCYTSAKKYDKVLGTYLRGVHFSEFNYDVDYFDENGVTPNRYDEHGVHKCYIPFFANAKKSKRWSSGYHTIPSKSEMKRLVTTPPGYLLSYFDISGAEIRTISFMAQDEFMMDCYHKGLDPLV